jgi:hypothetical protein
LEIEMHRLGSPFVGSATKFSNVVGVAREELPDGLLRYRLKTGNQPSDGFVQVMDVDTLLDYNIVRSLLLVNEDRPALEQSIEWVKHDRGWWP